MELTAKSQRENMPRLVYLWKKYNNVEGLPKNKLERDYLVSQISKAASDMSFEWKKRHDVLESMWAKIQNDWELNKETKKICQENIKKNKKELKKIEKFLYLQTQETRMNTSLGLLLIVEKCSEKMKIVSKTVLGETNCRIASILDI
jgi:hypothetical protein